MNPFGVDIDLVEGIMAEHDHLVVRRTSEMAGYYADPAALAQVIDEQNDPLHYEVFEKALPEQDGHLMFSISRLQPGLVGDECFMTKGHYHAVIETAEIYWCIRGQGYMLMKTRDGQCALEPMQRNRLVYVPPYWAHRSINTSSEPLISLCVYPAEAGHDYGDIKHEGFPKRVFIRDGEEIIE